jgi:hypothetical protein
LGVPLATASFMTSPPKCSYGRPAESFPDTILLHRLANFCCDLARISLPLQPDSELRLAQAAVRLVCPPKNYTLITYRANRVVTILIAAFAISVVREELDANPQDHRRALSV